MLHNRRLQPQIPSLRLSTTNNHLHPYAKGRATDFWFYQAFKPSHIALNNSAFSSIKVLHRHPGCIFSSSRIAVLPLRLHCLGYNLGTKSSVKGFARIVNSKDLRLRGA